MAYNPDQPDQQPERPDATTRMPPVDRNQPGGTHQAGDATIADGSPAADATVVAGPVQPRWTARANVPTPGSQPAWQPAPAQWVEEEEDPYHGRSWFTPVLVGLAALALVAALGVGIWLIYRATANGDNAPVAQNPAPAVSAATTAAVPPPSVAPTSDQPSPSDSPSPSTSPPPAAVVVPPMRGDTVDEATTKLKALQLKVKMTQRVDGSLPPGQVLDSTPTAGTSALPGDTVTLIVAKAPAPSGSSVSPSTKASS